MYSHNYAQEISAKSTEKQVPLVVAVLIFAIMGAAIWFGYQGLKATVLKEEPIAVTK